MITDPDWRVAWSNRGARGLMRRFQELRPDLCIDPLDTESASIAREYFSKLAEG